MERIPLGRIGGACAVLYTILIMVFLVLLITTGLIDVEGADETLLAMDEHQAGAAITAMILVIAPILLAIAGLAFFHALRGAGSAMWVALVAFSGGGLLIVYRGLVYLAITYELAPAYANATGETKSTLAVVDDTLETFAAGADMIGAALIAGIGVALFSAAILRTKVAPAWVAWLGFAVAILDGWFTLLGPAAEIFEIITFIVFPGFWVWMVAMGVAVWRAPNPDTAAA